MALIHRSNPIKNPIGDENNYDNWNRSHELQIKNLPNIGQKKRFNTMQRRLSMFFNITKQEGVYADNRNTKGRFVPVFITLTYPSNKEWKPDDITSYIKKIRQYGLNNWGMKLRIAWVAETTKNGVIHYHLITWIPRNKRLPKPSQVQVVNGRTYPPMWPHRAKLEGVRKGVYGYMLKYISKGCIVGGLGVSKQVLTSNIIRKGKNGNVLSAFIGQFNKTNYIDKDFNECTFKSIYRFQLLTRKVTPRIFGYSGLKKEQRERITYFMLPKYVKDSFGYTRIGDNIRRVKGGFQLFKANRVDSLYKYATYSIKGLEQKVLCNFTKHILELNGNHEIAYIFGANWSMIPEQSTDDQWFPF